MLGVKRLKLIAHKLPELAREMQQRVSEQFRFFIEQELLRQHSTGRSIYNDYYPLPKKGNQPMFDTGELAGGYEVRVINGGRQISVSNSSAHTIVNCDGKHTHLPDERGLPSRWEAKLKSIQKAEERRFMAAVNSYR